jgi:hypothetical protein
MRRLGDELGALAEGRPQEAGPLTDYAQQAASRVRDAARQLDERGFDAVVEDVAEFGRRRPGMFLAAAGIAGFAVGRMVRAGRAGAGVRPDAGRPALPAPASRSYGRGDGGTLPSGQVPGGGTLPSGQTVPSGGTRPSGGTLR